MLVIQSFFRHFLGTSSVSGAGLSAENTVESRTAGLLCPQEVHTLGYHESLAFVINDKCFTEYLPSARNC